MRGVTTQNDHLIERAAARLREANESAVPDLGRLSNADGGRAGASAPITPSLPFQPIVAAPAAGPPPPRTTAQQTASTSRANSDRAANTVDEADQAASIQPSAPPGIVPHAELAPASDKNADTQAASPCGPDAPASVQLNILEQAGMVVARRTRTRISEEYRIAAGRILRALHEAPGSEGARNVLMVTSARPGEGKSFTALNLAGSIAQNGPDQVLLVDVDSKARPLSDQLGLGDASGFLDAVADPALRLDDLVRRSAIPNLAILPVGNRDTGPVSHNDAAVSIRPIIPAIQRISRRFPRHLIVLDTPPCLSTSDPHAIAPHVAEIVMVVEAERTQKAEVEAAIDLVRVCPNITLLLNKVRMTTSHTFGAYDYFGAYA